MKLTPYSELVNLSKEERAKKTAVAGIAKQKKRGELKVAELEEAISSLEDKVNQLCSATELNFEAIVNAQDELALAIRRRDQFQTVVKELFPES